LRRAARFITTRTYVTGQVGNIFKPAGIALPNNVSEQSAD
jgi:hypothetical protein